MDDPRQSFAMPPGTDIAWCPGCGNHRLLEAVDIALGRLGIDRKRLVMVSGIGQAAKAPQYLDVNMFNGLHGRALPAAFGIRMANRELVVVVESGDGDIYGEGGNHLIHAIRRNFDVTVIVHDNMVYGLTKGQASPTSARGMKTPVQTAGVIPDPLNPPALAIALDAPFVARAWAGDVEQTAAIIGEAISFRGFALVDVFQPCVVFNKLNTWKWFGEHVRPVPGGHDPTDRIAAFRLALENDTFPLGILYRNDGREPYEEIAGFDPAPLFTHRPEKQKLQTLIETFR